MPKVLSRNPATGEILKEFESTPLDEIPSIFERSRLAQTAWAALAVKQRVRVILQLREVLLNHVDDVVELIVLENGKPRFEALANELLPSVELLTYFAKEAPKTLRNQRIQLTLMKHRASYLNHWPLGVVSVISPWNYPFYLPFGEIAISLLAGNSVVFKPSEATPQTGLKIQELCEEAGLPKYLLQSVLGDGVVGSAIIQNRPNKVFFTGCVSTGKKIMAAAAEHLIPVSLELGGKDAMIVLPDADLDFASSAALWGGFTNSGQGCASVERIIVHQRIAQTFTELLRTKIQNLRQGPSNNQNNDLGVVTIEKQKEIYDRQLLQVRNTGAKIEAGGTFNSDRSALKPTLVSGPDIETLEVGSEESFGPIITITEFKSISEAVEKANESRYGLLASIITRDIQLAEQIARQLHVGTVTINEVTYTAALPETPWGGVKDSGFGRKHGKTGLLEFVNIRHIHKPRSKFLTFKSLWWFPYTPYQYSTFRALVELYRRHWLDRLRAFPHFLWNLAHFLKRERRL